MRRHQPPNACRLSPSPLPLPSPSLGWPAALFLSPPPHLSRWPSSSVHCCISSPLQLIAASLLCRDPLQCLSTPSPLLAAVTPPSHRNCVVCGWHFESLLSCLFNSSHSTFYHLLILIVVYLPSALCLAFTSQPTVMGSSTQCCRHSHRRR